MGPSRTGKGTGALQFDRRFAGVGRIKKSSGTTHLHEFRRRDALLTKLFETSALDVLRAFRDGAITIEEIVAADRDKAPLMTLDRVMREAPLWATVDAITPKVGRSGQTRSRFVRAWVALQASEVLSPRATVGDLARVDWTALERRWGKSAADWNHVRRAVSRFLTLFLRDKFHPMRRQVMASFPSRKEIERVPDLSPAIFLRLVDAAPSPARAPLLALALTGMRVGEYLTADESALMPAVYGVRVGGKTGEGTVYVTPETWPVIAQAIPCPLGPPIAPGSPVDRSLRYARLRRAWQQAQRAVGVSGLRLHDLRHLFGQVSSDANVPTAQTQAALRHADPRMTRRYEMQSGARRAAEAVAETLGFAPAKKKRA